MEKISRIKEIAKELNTNIGILNCVSYNVYNKAIGELTKMEFNAVITEYIGNKTNYEPEKLF
jgi:S-methylmethionine-dependent homocysteine/selenocysteine methylase